ncbi:hypothetical protein [Glaciibacter sp. 2TAF33]|uniref:hypothetical protein n=1 Tax=Glaciibacter sp. 2TAF33 TaxID=3233015 RepID=UPI003F8E9ED1
MSPSLPLLLPLLVGLVLVAVVVWVLQDARSREREHRPVSVTVAGVMIEQPQVWAALCVLLFAVVFPLYLAARRATG